MRSNNFWHRQVMGVLNVTPDSFSDGGKYALKTQALIHARRMIDEGASIIDIGGESTRPGAATVSVDEEIERVVPIIEVLAKECDVHLSIDTRKTPVMKAALAAGATMINDVAALQDEGAIECAATAGVPVCLMHMQGTPQTMQRSPEYTDVVLEVKTYLQSRIDACVAGGIARDKIIIDLGFGFGKTVEHNIALLRQLSDFLALECPILLGMSRKSTLGKLAGDLPIEERLHAGVAAAVLAWNNGAHIMRTHDVLPTVQALAIVNAIVT
jgi:dihydropteroate synthase